MPCGVFISYQPADWPWAEHVCQSLEGNGIPCRTAPRELSPEPGELPSGPAGSLILVLSSSQSPLPRQLIQELEKVRYSGLELRALRAEEVQTPDGLVDFLKELRGAGQSSDEFSIPSQYLQAIPAGSSPRNQLPAGAPSSRLLLEGPKTAPKRNTPVLAAVLVSMLFVGVWAIRGSSANLQQYEKVFAQQQAEARRAQADRVLAHEALEEAQRFSSQDRWREADRTLTKAIALDGGYAQAYFERGRARFWERQYLAAIEDFNSVIRLDPNLAPGAITLRILAEQAQAKPTTAP